VIKEREAGRVSCSEERQDGKAGPDFTIKTIHTRTDMKRRFMRICMVTGIFITFTNIQESFVSRIFMNTCTLKKIIHSPTGQTHPRHEH
jgi:hypothetical protein